MPARKPTGPSYQMERYVWFRLRQIVPELPQPFYLGIGRVFDARYDSRRNPQPPMKDHCIVKIALTEGGMIGLGDRTVRFMPGQAFCRVFGEHHVWDAYDPRHRGPWRFLGLIFKGVTGLAMFRALIERHGRIFRIDPDSLIQRRMMALVNEPMHTVELGASEGMRLVTDLLVELTLSAEQREQQTPRRRTADAAAQLVLQHIQRPWTVTDLADEVGVSREHLTRLFKQQFGMAPHHYVQQMKIREACQRLRLTQMPIKQIVNDLGFGGRATFLRSFRRLTGTSPQEYRRGGDKHL